MSILMICKKIGGESFKDTFLTVHLGTAATEIRRVSLLRITFYVSLDRSVLRHRRSLMLEIF